MPGFTLGFPNEQNTVNSKIAPIFTFTWSVERLFDETIKSDTNAPLLYLKDCTPPAHTFETEEYNSASIKLKYASRITWADVKLTFYDTVGLLPKIQEWQEDIWTVRGGMKVANEYKSNSIISLNTMDGKPANKWNLYGSWPKQVDHAALTYTSSDMHSVSITLAYDWAEIRNAAGLSTSTP